MNHVSVIIPVFNAEKYLRRCLFSILNQTYQQIEIILINDGSTDQSGKICQHYADRYDHIHVIHQANQGPAAARNTGLQNATGTYIQFVDADDTIKPAMITYLAHEMDRGVDLVISGFTTKDRTFTPSAIGQFTKQAFIPQLGKLYFEIILPSLCNKMYRAALIKTAEVEFIQTCSFGEDLLFNLDYLETCQTIQISPRAFYEYRRNTHSLTNQYVAGMFFNHKILHQKTKNFLITNDHYQAENKQYINIIFTNGIIHSLTNLFHKDSGLTYKQRKALLYKIITDSTVHEQLPYFTHNVQAKVFRPFIKLKSANSTTFLLQTKEMMRHRFTNLFKSLQRINKTGY